jgi:hypothetical protein
MIGSGIALEKILDILKKQEELRDTILEIRAVVKPEADLWDNSDLMRYWKVSSRTLADWRARGVIGYVQVGNKIWYPRAAREAFLSKNFNGMKGEVESNE